MALLAKRGLTRSIVVGALGAASSLVVGCLSNPDSPPSPSEDAGTLSNVDAGPAVDSAVAVDATVSPDAMADAAPPADDAPPSPDDTAQPPIDSALPDAGTPPADAGPGVIADLTAVGGPDHVTLTWAAVPAAPGYNLYQATVSGGEPALGSPTAYSITTTGTTRLTATVTDLTPGVDYYFFVTADDPQGTEIPTPSNEANAKVQPLPPVVVTTTTGDGQMTLTWNSVQEANSYNLYYNTTSALTGGTKVPSAVSGVAITGLTNAQSYFFGVTAVASGVEGPLSNEVNAAPAAQLAAYLANVSDKGWSTPASSWGAPRAPGSPGCRCHSTGRGMRRRRGARTGRSLYPRGPTPGVRGRRIPSPSAPPTRWGSPPSPRSPCARG